MGRSGRQVIRGASLENLESRTMLDAVITVDIGGVAPDPRNAAVSSINFTFSEPIENFDKDDLVLKLDGEDVNILPATLTTLDDTTFTLGNLDALTAAEGAYTLTLTDINGVIQTKVTGADTLTGELVSESWITDTTAPTAGATVQAHVTGPVADAVDIVFDTPVSGVGIGGITLTLNGEAVDLTGASLDNVGNANTTFTLSGLSSIANADGNYVLTLSAAGIADEAGNPLAADVTANWALSHTVTADIQAVASPTNVAVDSLTITFSEAVNNFDKGDLTLTRGENTQDLTGATLTTNDNVTFTLGNLSELTGADGEYALTLTDSGDQIVAQADGTNGLAAGDFSSGWAMDATAPTAQVNITAHPTGPAVDSVEIVFDDVVTGLNDLSGVTLKRGNQVLDLSGATAGTQDGITYTITGLSSVDNVDGNYTLTLSAAGITDLAGNPLAADVTANWSLSHTITAEIEQIASPINTTVPTLTITFSEAVNNFAKEDLVLALGQDTLDLTNATLTTDDNVIYTLGNLNDLTGAEGNYTLTLTDTGDQIVSQADGTIGLAADSVTSAWTTDTTAPTAQAAIQPHVAGPVVDAVDIVFDSPVSGVDISGITLKLGNDALDLTGASLDTQDNITFTLSGLSGIATADGAYTLTLSAGNIQDDAGNPLAADLVTNWSLSHTVTAAVGQVTSPTNAAVDSLTITFSEAVNNFAKEDLVLTIGQDTLDLTNATLTSDDNVVFTLGNLADLTGGDGYYTLTLTDTGDQIVSQADGTNGLSTDPVAGGWTMDTIAPTVTITRDAPVDGTSVSDTATITFSKEVTGFDLTQLVLTKGGVAVDLTGAGMLETQDNITFTLSGLSALTGGAGNYVLTVTAETTTIEDLAGNAFAQDAQTNWTIGTAAVVSITGLDAVASEAAGQGRLGLFTLARTGAIDQPLTVNIAMSGTAKNGKDYTTIAKTVTFQAGSATVDVTVTPIDDGLAENAETAILTLKTGKGYTLGVSKTATVGIADSSPTVTVTAAAGDFTEAAGVGQTKQLTVTISGGNVAQDTLVFLDIKGTAKGGKQYQALPKSVLIPAGSDHADLTLTALDDKLAKGAQTVVVNSKASKTFHAGQAITVNLVDAEPVIGITAKTANALESDLTPGVFTITRTGGDSSQPLTVTLKIGGTAKAGRQYAALTKTVTFGAGVTSIDINVTPIDDHILQKKNGTVVVSVAVGKLYSIDPDCPTATVTIQENNG